MEDFRLLLQQTLTPIALISGVGLLLLSMINRYNHAIDRVRYLIKEKKSLPQGETDKIDRSIQIIYQRCRMMRNAIFCIALSIAASGAMILTIALEGFISSDLFTLKALLLISAIALIVVATLMFVTETTYSLKALKIELEE
ncbi:MAG TPA: DUF2721 domain-containing protein [Flavilitoribacter sp.]|nr:DUF2721 domain-containing protein [Flavilitoribacter sp.]HMQ87702.1 DUF2721 domain-containing protein [Flavilitoribacter sp.]